MAAEGGGRVSSVPRSTWRHRGLRRRTGLGEATGQDSGAGHCVESGSPGQPRSPARRSAEPGSGRRGRPRRERLRLDVSLRWTAALATVPEAGRRGRGGAARGRVGRVARETFAGRGGWRRTLTGTLWPRAPRPWVWAPCGRPQSRRGVERPEGQAGLQTERAGVRGSA